MPTPKMVLIITAQNAAESVSSNAKITSGWRRALITGAKPLENVLAATNATGQTTRKSRYPITITRNAQRVTRYAVLSRIAGHPPRDHVECDDHDQRYDQQDRGHRRRFGELVSLHRGHDAHRGHLGGVGQVTREQDQGTVLADRPAERECRS